LWRHFGGNYDYLGDQQTGQSSGDIVGDIVGDSNGNFGFFVTFNDNGSSSATDGTLGFRLRLDAAGGDNNNPAFNRVAWLGIDADTNGSIDAFLGLNLSGSSSELLIAAPGTGANTSPSTTTIETAVARYTYATTPSNYNYRPVDYLIDGGSTNDVTTTTTGDPDYYVSFMVPFADVVGFLSTTSSIQITDQSALRYVTATSTQTNSINQDLGGVDGGTKSGDTWVDLGGFTQTVTADGTLVPEPSSGLLVLASLTAALFIRRRR
jgi:hypothetical protein